jgi:hypothetical protein
MKFLKTSILAAVLAATVCVQSAYAQIDYWGQTRSLVLAPPTLIASTSILVTNSPVDVKDLGGVARVDFSLYTNSACAVKALLYHSANPTNGWVALTNYASATSLAETITNYYLFALAGTNNSVGDYVTNNWNIPGTITVPTAYTAGWATPYVLPAPFTNQNAVTLNGQTITSIGLPIDDALRYLMVVWQTSGTATNAEVSANLIARRLQGP